MSGLDAWEQAWEEWLLQAPSEQSGIPADSDLHAGLPARVPAERQIWLEAARQAQKQRLRNLIPARIAFLLGPDYLQELLEKIPLSRLSCTLGSDFRLALLDGLEQALQRDGVVIPHLNQVLNYEKALLRLHYHCLPRILPETLGPLLADWVCLLEAGPFLRDILESLRQEQPLPPCSEYPLQVYLLSRDMAGARLEALSPLVAACLRRCNGQRSWAELAVEALAEAEAPEMDLPVLLDWQLHLLRRGVLLLSAAAEVQVLLGEGQTPL